MMVNYLEFLRRKDKDADSGFAESTITFEDFIGEVLSLDEELFNLNAVLSDPVSGRMTSEFRDEILLTGIECGESYAKKYTEEGQNIYQLLEQEKIKYVKESMPAGGGHVIFAQYVEPNNITLFTDSVEKYEELIIKTKYKEILGRKQFEELLIAHEFFHYLEFKNRQTISTLNKKLELWGVFGYKYKTTLVSLSEIAAMVFAKKSTNFKFSPFILDILLTYSYNKEMAYKIFRQVANRKEQG